MLSLLLRRSNWEADLSVWGNLEETMMEFFGSVFEFISISKDSLKAKKMN
uniref:Uncharacterized protein n=1 Tax=Meloidogyne enterolobii TaxID=390850 RepID=A0A6V7XFS5_MELEN|nr:unnamed protein product [Meloidogyne enterolobii]